MLAKITRHGEESVVKENPSRLKVQIGDQYLKDYFFGVVPFLSGKGIVLPKIASDK